MTSDVASHRSRSWTSFTAGFAVGVIVGIPLGVIGFITLIAIAQIVTAMIALP